MTGTVHILLIGLPGSGKTVVGLDLARHLGRPFIDVNSSSTIPAHQHVARGTDAETLENAEQDWLRRIVTTTGPLVVAAPWSSLDIIESLRVDNLLWIVWLQAPVDVLVRRVRHDDDGDPAEIRPILEEQAALRCDVAERVTDVRVDTTRLDPPRIVDRLVEQWSASPARAPHA